MPARICHHLRENGFFCKSPALSGRDYCYFHLNLRGRRLKSARARRTGEYLPLNLPFPEDMYAIQVGLHEVMLAIADKRIDHRDASLLLYSLQQASTNLGNRRMSELDQIVLPSDRFAGSYPAFEDDHGLPEGIDVSLDPDQAWDELEPLPKPVLPAHLEPADSKSEVA